jgi:hypothetical protein
MRSGIHLLQGRLRDFVAPATRRRFLFVSAHCKKAGETPAPQDIARRLDRVAWR